MLHILKTDQEVFFIETTWLSDSFTVIPYVNHVRKLCLNSSTLTRTKYGKWIRQIRQNHIDERLGNKKYVRRKRGKIKRHRNFTCFFCNVRSYVKVVCIRSKNVCKIEYEIKDDIWFLWGEEYVCFDLRVFFVFRKKRYNMRNVRYISRLTKQDG